MKDKVHIHRRQSAKCERIPGRVLAVLLAVFATSATAAIPEPDLVWYGKVLTSSGGATVRLTSGTLVWHIERVTGESPIVLAKQLRDLLNTRNQTTTKIKHETYTHCIHPAPLIGA